MTSPENQKQQDLKNGCVGCLTIFTLLLLSIGACSILFSTKEQTSTERLDEWFNGGPSEIIGDSNVYIDCENQLKDDIIKKTNDNVLMRDEYEKIGNYNISAPDTATKIISWKFRAKIRSNGDYGDGFATCRASKLNGKKVSVSFKVL